MVVLYLLTAVVLAVAAVFWLIRGMRRDRLDQELLLSPVATKTRLDALVELRRADRIVIVLRVLWPFSRRPPNPDASD